MLTAVIGLIAIVVIGTAVSNGEWGVVGVSVAVVLFLMMCSGEERKDREAYRNRRDYWRKGGPGR